MESPNLIRRIAGSGSAMRKSEAKGSNDVLVAISQSGKTRALLESVSLAREAGATVIRLAPQNTPLREYERRAPGICAGIFPYCSFGGYRCVGDWSGATSKAAVERAFEEAAKKSKNTS